MEKKKRIFIAIIYALINPIFFIFYWNSSIVAKIISLPFALVFYVFAYFYALFERGPAGVVIYFSLITAFFSQLILLILLSLTIDDIVRKIKQEYKKILAIALGVTLIFSAYNWLYLGWLYQGTVDNSIIIKKEPVKLVLTHEDMGEEWIQGRSRPEGENGYFVEFFGAEGAFTREKIFNTIWIFSSEEKSKEFFNAYIMNRGWLERSKSRVGDESFYETYPYPGGKYIIFRENNIIVEVDYSDREPQPIGRNIETFVELIEQKIIVASKDK